MKLIKLVAATAILVVVSFSVEAKPITEKSNRLVLAGDIPHKICVSMSDTSTIRCYVMPAGNPCSDDFSDGGLLNPSQGAACNAARQSGGCMAGISSGC